MSILNVHIPLSSRLANRRAGHQYRNSLSTIWEGFNGEGRSRERIVGFDNLECVYFRNAKYADEVGDANISHKGWYADEFCDEKIRGVVAQLPSRKGKVQWLAGYEETGGMIVFYLAIHETQEEAARMADEHSRVMAEREREYHAEEERKRRIEELKSEVKQAREDIKALKRSLASLRSTIKANKRQLATLD